MIPFSFLPSEISKRTSAASSDIFLSVKLSNPIPFKSKCTTRQGLNGAVPSVGPWPEPWLVPWLGLWAVVSSHPLTPKKMKKKRRTRRTTIPSSSPPESNRDKFQRFCF